MDRVLFAEEWRSERLLTVFRAAIWTLVGCGTGAFDVSHGVAPTAGSIVTLGWGITCAVLVVTVLRRRYHRSMALLLTTADFATLAVAHHFVHQSYSEFAPDLIPHQLSRNAFGVMLLMAANVSRFSWRLTAWSIALACAVHTYTLWLLGRLEPAAFQDYVLIGSLGALLLYAGVRARHVLLRMKQRDALARFLPGPIVDRLEQDPSAFDLGGEEQEATILFADIRRFTEISSTMRPAEVVAMLNEYFGEMVDEVFAWDGILDKFIGDGMCAVFGPPLVGEDQAARAMRCAAGMLDRLGELNRRRTARGEVALDIGIGLHSGKVLAGNIGTPVRMEYTHIGDVVNTASRIEGLTSQLAEPILVSDTTYQRAGGERSVPARALEPVSVKGKDAPLSIYAIDVGEMSKLRALAPPPPAGAAIPVGAPSDRARRR